MITLLCSLAASSASAQTAPASAEAPMQIAIPQAAPVSVLPANTQITLSMNDMITSKGKKFSEGDTFDMTVTHDVMLGQYVIIPKGSRGVGRITWMTSKGMFGKSGKMEISIEYVEVGGRQIPVKGNYRQEGEGNTVATVGTVIIAGVFGAFVTGKSAVIPQGRELTAHTKADLPVSLPGPINTATAVLTIQPVPAAAPIAPAPGLAPNAAVKCVTCN